MANVHAGRVNRCAKSGRPRAGIRREGSLTAICALLLSLLAGVHTEPARAEDPPPPSTAGFDVVPVIEHLDTPTAFRFTRDGKLFVAEHAGRVKVFDGLEDQDPDILINLTAEVHWRENRGLTGLEVHPDFPDVPWVWLLYSVDSFLGAPAPLYGPSDPRNPEPFGQDRCPGGGDEGCAAGAKLVRLIVDPVTNRVVSSNDVASWATHGTPSHEPWCSQFPSHHVGTVIYGSDGALYVGSGDGANWRTIDYGQLGDQSPSSPTRDNVCGDLVGRLPDGHVDPASSTGGSLRAQALQHFGRRGYEGSVMRIEPVTGATPGTTQHLALGLRNPFRLVERPGTGEFWIGDTGWNDWEEIDVVPTGAIQPGGAASNFGWPCYEGPDPTPQWKDLGNQLCDDMYAGALPFPHQPPAYAYSSFDPDRGGPLPGARLGDCPEPAAGISAIQFYGGTSYPEVFRGGVFFGDSYSGCVFAAQVKEVSEPGGPAHGVPDPETVQLVAVDLQAADIQPGPGDVLYVADVALGRIVALVHGVTCPTDDRLEENDTRASARPVGAGSLGAIACPNDPDWYNLQTDGHSDVTVQLRSTNTGQDLHLSVHPPQRTGSTAGVISGGEADIVTFRAKDSSYGILVDGATGFANYTLTISICSDDRLTNDDPAEPQLLTPSPPIPAVQCPTENVEYYAVQGTPGEVWKVDLTYPASAGSIAIGPVRDPDGALIDSRSVGGEGHQRVQIPITKPGRYGFTLQDASPGVSIPYTLQALPMTALELCPAGLSDAWADISSQARAAVPGTWPIVGNICRDGEEDWFSFAAAASSAQVSAELPYDGQGPGVLSLGLYNADGQLVARAADVNPRQATRRNARLRLSYRSDHDQTLYLRVTGGGGYGNGNHDDYRLDVRLR